MRKVMRHYTSQPFQSNLHLLFLTKNKQSIITFIDSLCFVLCENITDAGMQAVTFSFLIFWQFLRDRELILQIQCFFPPRFCKCFVFVSVTTFSLQFCILLINFIQQQPKKWKVLLIVDWHYINTHNILPVKNSDNAVINDLVRVITAGRKDAQHFHIKKNESCSAWDNTYCVRSKRSPHHQMLIQLEDFHSRQPRWRKQKNIIITTFTCISF